MVARLRSAGNLAPNTNTFFYGLGWLASDESFERVRRVLADGDLARTEGRWLYANVLLREGERDASLREEGLRLIGQLADEFPDNPIFRRPLGGSAPAP